MSTSDRKTKGGRNKAPPAAVQRELWARSAGICCYPGCAEILYRDQAVFWEPINLGEQAHNVASSANGPRGDAARSANLSDDPENLLMLCRKHHKTADALADEYREETLTRWKRRHEDAVRHAAQLTRGEAVFPLIVQSLQIGGHDVHVDETQVIRAILDGNKSPTGRPYRVAIDNRAQPDNAADYWAAQVRTLRDHLKLARLRQQQEGTDAPIGVFALAEMPTLMALGHAMGDKTPFEIYQYTRHANSWAFTAPEDASPGFTYTLPDAIGDSGVAVSVSVTATIEDRRVQDALPEEDIPIVRFASETQGTEVVTSPNVIETFRRELRQCLTDIEIRSPRFAPIYLFPCMPLSLAIAAGACVMPKVSNPIRVYDAKGPDGPFQQCLDLPLPLSPENTPLPTQAGEGATP